MLLDDSVRAGGIHNEALKRRSAGTEKSLMKTELQSGRQSEQIKNATFADTNAVNFLCRLARGTFSSSENSARVVLEHQICSTS